MGLFGQLAGGYAGAKRQAREQNIQDDQLARQQEDDQIRRLALMSALQQQGVVGEDQRENLPGDIPAPSMLGQNMPRQQGTSVDTGIVDPSRYAELGSIGGKKYYADKAQQIAAKRAADRAAKIQEALRYSEIDKNNAEAYKARNQQPASEPLEHVDVNGKDVLTPRGQAAGKAGYHAPTGTNSGYRDLSAVASIRSQFNGEKIVQNAGVVAENLGRIRAAAKAPSAAGDLALIFAYMKMLDPGSTVREGEFANAQNAGGVPDQIINAYNKVKDGTRLNPNQRALFLQQAMAQAESQRQLLAGVIGRYADIAKRNGFDPKDVVTDPFQYQQAAPARNLPFPQY